MKADDLRRLESGYKNITPRISKALADFFELPPTSFIYRTDRTKKTNKRRKKDHSVQANSEG